MGPQLNAGRFGQTSMQSRHCQQTMRGAAADSIDQRRLVPALQRTVTPRSKAGAQLITHEHLLKAKPRECGMGMLIKRPGR